MLAPLRQDARSKRNRLATCHLPAPSCTKPRESRLKMIDKCSKDKTRQPEEMGNRSLWLGFATANLSSESRDRVCTTQLLNSFAKDVANKSSHSCMLQIKIWMNLPNLPSTRTQGWCLLAKALNKKRECQPVPPLRPSQQFEDKEPGKWLRIHSNRDGSAFVLQTQPSDLQLPKLIGLAPVESRSRAMWKFSS